MRKLIINIGDIFGRLTVYGDKSLIRNGLRCRYILCKCICGNKSKVTPSSLMSGTTKSCGCIQKESVSFNMKTHGKSKTPFYSKWMSMKKRCNNKNNISYKWYGGRGIKISKRWESFESFYDDMHEGYLKHLDEFGRKETTLDRIDGNGNYCKDNCRWLTLDGQRMNRENTIFVNYKDTKYSMKELTIRFDIGYHRLYHKLFKKKIPIEKAIVNKSKLIGVVRCLKNEHKIQYKRIAELLGISISSVYRFNRLYEKRNDLDNK